ncbi:MAG: 2-amino-4-hydroxy-6-hydroxymethyldihydropteridine diphosphokinase [Candidatus Aminicenantales bacterium]
MIYFLSLGSNIGDRKRNLARARRLLAKNGVAVLKASSVYRTEPVDVRDQPWFDNQVLKVRTGRRPHELLALAKSIEAALGRVPNIKKGPRTIDIDILLAGDTVLETPDLTIPHPRMAGRNFVLVPLCELAPGAFHPVLLKTVHELLRTCPDKSSVLREGSRGRRHGRNPTP